LDRVEDTKETFLDFVVMLDLWRLDQTHTERAKGSTVKIRATFLYATASAEKVVERVVTPGTLKKQEFLLVIPPLPPEPLETKWSVLLEITELPERQEGQESQDAT
jgi:hypothetical protein